MAGPRKSGVSQETRRMALSARLGPRAVLPHCAANTGSWFGVDQRARFRQNPYRFYRFGANSWKLGPNPLPLRAQIGKKSQAKHRMPIELRTRGGKLDRADMNSRDNTKT